MMKRFIYVALLACFTMSALADETNVFTLQSGDALMTIDISKGGKILSLKYKDQEVISQSRFPESFGSTFWTSPQKEWNWPPVPEFDKQPYTVKRRDMHLVISQSRLPASGSQRGQGLQCRQQGRRLRHHLFH